jgi:GNAT superfamily N-acetyltransferase
MLEPPQCLRPRWQRPQIILLGLLFLGSLGDVDGFLSFSFPNVPLSPALRKNKACSVGLRERLQIHSRMQQETEKQETEQKVQKAETGRCSPTFPVSRVRRDMLKSLVLSQLLANSFQASSEAEFVPPVLAAQREAAEAEAEKSQAVGDVRSLGSADIEAMLQLTAAQGWDNTKEDLKLLIAMKGSRAFGIRSSSGQLVSMCAITHLPAQSVEGTGAAWLSYVITRKDFRRRGLARKVCIEALNWLDVRHPSCSIGLYGEPTKGAPLYSSLGFHDVGKTRFWSGSYSANAILAADTSSTPATNGKRAVNSRVRAITVGASTALAVGTGSALLPGFVSFTTQFTCFNSKKVQILTPEALPARCPCER